MVIYPQTMGNSTVNQAQSSLQKVRQQMRIVYQSKKKNRLAEAGKSR